MKSLLRASSALVAAAVMALSTLATPTVSQASEVISRRFHHECKSCGAPIYANLRCYGHDSRGRPLHRWVVSTHNCPARHRGHDHDHGHKHSHGHSRGHDHGYSHYDRGPSNKDILIDAVSGIILRKLQDR